MERNTEPSMETLWSRCRIVGFVNLIINAFYIIVLLLMMANLMIVVFERDKIISETDKNEENEMVNDLIRNQFTLIMIIIFSIFIIMLIVLILFIRVNYGITSETAPDNGVKTGRWLIYHKVLFCFCIIFGILMVIGNGLGHFIISVISLIILAIEIYIVNAYHTKVTGGII